MMYDGIEYQNNTAPKRGKSSTGSRKDLWQKIGFWLNPLNQFWENESYTEEGKEHCREFVKSLPTDYVFKKPKFG